jgi:predicted NAD/FAD-dependent oxidoreductase
MSTREKSYDYLIIGAGMAGLAAAHELRARGRESLVIDKGRGVGGRLATRWSETPAGVRAWYDHGAQFFTVRSQVFRERVESWQRAGLVSEWARGFADGQGAAQADGHPRYVTRGGMNALARDLAATLDVQVNTQVGAIGWGDGWEVALATGERISAGALILTPPVPQSLALLAAGGTSLPAVAQAALTAIEYDPCFAVLAELDGPSQLPAPGALQLRGEPIAWIGDNHRKGISPDAFTVTIHAGPDFTRTHWESPYEEVATKLLAAAADWLGAEVRTWQVHRWRYSHPQTPYPEACLRLDLPGPLVLAGDAFGEPRVEGAFLSGVAAAAALDS